MNMTQAQKARRNFIDSFRKLAAHFGESLLDELNEAKSTKAEVIEAMRPFCQKSAAPGQLWDEADDDLKKVMWQAIILAAITKANDCSTSSVDYLNLAGEWAKIDPLDDTDPNDAAVPVQANVAVPDVVSVLMQMANINDNDDDEDEDEDEDEDDDDDDSSIDPSIYGLKDPSVFNLPDVLYHGTLKNCFKSIQQDGIKALRRPCVTLQTNTDASKKTAMRRGDPVDDVIVLVVDAKRMAEDGIPLRKENYGYGDVYEADEVPPQYIKDKFYTFSNDGNDQFLGDKI
jgi:hypothetical protein